MDALPAMSLEECFGILENIAEKEDTSNIASIGRPWPTTRTLFKYCRNLKMVLEILSGSNLHFLFGYLLRIKSLLIEVLDCLSLVSINPMATFRIEQRFESCVADLLVTVFAGGYTISIGSRISIDATKFTLFRGSLDLVNLIKSTSCDSSVLDRVEVVSDFFASLESTCVRIDAVKVIEDIVVDIRKRDLGRAYDRDEEVLSTCLDRALTVLLFSLVNDYTVKISLRNFTIIWKGKLDADLKIDKDSVVGYGGFGVVYVGYYKDKKVAVKELRAMQPSEEKLCKQAFQREADILQRCQEHPNIIRFFGCAAEGILVMELACCSLYDLLYSPPFNSRKFLLAKKIELFIECCDCLKWLHARNIIHRDIKTANLLLSEDEKIKLADFGVGKIVGESKTTIGLDPKGTTMYLAPEIICTDELQPLYSESTDMYSFTVTLNEFLAGQRPYPDNTNVVAKMNRNPAMRPVPFCFDSANVNAEYSNLVSNGWHQDPTARPSFSDMMIMLQNIHQLLVNN